MALRGRFDLLTPTHVAGWALDSERPDLPVSLVVLVNGEVVAHVLADQLRRDVGRAVNTNGYHGFNLALPKPLVAIGRHIVDVRRETDGAPLPQSPRALDVAAVFDARTREQWRTILACAQTEQELAERLDFLDEEMTKLRAVYVAKRSGLEEKAQARRRRWAGEEVGQAKPRALVIDDRMPDVRRDAGSHAIVSHMQALQRLGYDVSFAPATLSGDPAVLEAIGVEVYRKPLVGAVESLLEQQPGAYAAVYLHRVQMAERYLGLVRAHQPRARVVYSLADLHHLRLARQAAVEGRPELKAFADRMRWRELTAAAGSDAVVTHSRAEAQMLAKNLPAAKIFVVPWAVEPRPTAAPFAARAGVAFLAGFAHPPNVDAAHELVGAVMPEVWRRDPSIKLLLVGSEMPPALRTLASERVEIVGFAPDLSEIFARVRLTIAPLAFGAGLKGKVLESLAAGVPCVCTPVAAEGFDFSPPLSGLVGVEAADLARLVLRLHEDEQANAEAAAAGVKFVETFASRPAVDAALAPALGLAAPPGAKREVAS